MTKSELQNNLISRHFIDTDMIKTLSKDELLDLFNELNDHSNLYPNNDEFDDSNDYLY